MNSRNETYRKSFNNVDSASKGREGKGREGKGREGKGREGKGREGKGREGKGREGKGREGKGREGKGREGKGREGKGREGKGREGKGREGDIDPACYYLGEEMEQKHQLEEQLRAVMDKYKYKRRQIRELNEDLLQMTGTTDQLVSDERLYNDLMAEKQAKVQILNI